MISANIYLPTSLILLFLLRKYIESKWGKCKNNTKLDGKVVVVTGANSGIGFETAKELAKRNATVILACRNIELANDAIKKIERELENSPKLIPMHLDLESVESIKNFAQTFKKSFENLHILINNAGVSYPKKRLVLAKNGLEIHFAVNYLGHFHLTNLLSEVLEKSTPSRVVNVSSKLHEKGNINIEDLNYEKTDLKTVNLYSNSKLANIYHCVELAKRNNSKDVSFYAVCPGWVYSNLFRHSIKWYHYIMVFPIAFFFMRSAKQGAQTVIYCATEANLKNGSVFRDCKEYASKHNINPDIAHKLWNKSEEILKELE